MNEETPTLTLDAADLSQSDYRLLREGKDVAPAVKEVTPAAVDADAVTPMLTEDGSPKPKEDKKGIELRFAELTGEIKSLKSQIADKTAAPIEQAAKPAVAAAPAVVVDPNDPEPDVTKFTDYVEWQKVWNRWDRRQETKALTVAAETAKRTEAAQTRMSAWNDRVKTASTVHADYAAVALNVDLPVTNAMSDAITTSDEHGTEILYRLGKDPAEAARIAKLSPVAQVREIGKLEAVIEAEKKAAAAASGDDTTDNSLTPSIAVSKAPPPIRPVSGASAAAAVGAKNFESMSQSEYRALRESNKIR